MVIFLNLKIVIIQRHNTVDQSYYFNCTTAYFVLLSTMINRCYDVERLAVIVPGLHGKFDISDGKYCIPEKLPKCGYIFFKSQVDVKEQTSYLPARSIFLSVYLAFFKPNRKALSNVNHS